MTAIAKLVAKEYTSAFLLGVCRKHRSLSHRSESQEAGQMSSILRWVLDSSGVWGRSGPSFLSLNAVPGLRAGPGSPHGLLTSVYFLMVKEGRALSEGPATLPTHKWLLTCVDAPVAKQHGALGKGLATVPAAERPFTSVQQLMLGEVGAVAEGPAALCTGKGFLARVHTLVLEERGTLAESCATECASIGLLACMSAFMLNQV